MVTVFASSVFEEKSKKDVLSLSLSVFLARGDNELTRSVKRHFVTLIEVGKHLITCLSGYVSSKPAIGEISFTFSFTLSYNVSMTNTLTMPSVAVHSRIGTL